MSQTRTHLMVKNFGFLIKHLSSIHLMGMSSRRYKMGLFDYYLSQNGGEFSGQRKRQSQGRGVRRTRVQRKSENGR